jgi:phenylalanyl-tRNA synthetase beta chain
LKISFEWLCDYANFERIEFDRIIEKINLSICEVDSVEEYRKELDSIKIVEITDIKQHPNNNLLFVCDVDFDNKKSTIVAKTNILKKGDIVCLATPGSVIRGKEILSTEFKSIISEGMFCSEYDLELSEDNSKILNFSDKNMKNKSLREILGFKDKIFTIDNKSITHRPDLWCHFGFARELAAQFNLPIVFNPYNSEFEFKKESSLDIEHSHNFHSYYGTKITNITVTESQSTIKNRLLKCGLRPINNVVDISNYVMLEMGQPTHFFDFDCFNSSVIKIENSLEKFEIDLLDGSRRKFDEGILLIKNNEKPVAIAGVMGGLDTSVRENSKNLILESAVFKREDIRKSIKQTNIRSDASTRYEKGLNPNTPLNVIHRICSLLKEGNFGNFDVEFPIGIVNTENKGNVIHTNLDFINKKLGKEISFEQLNSILTSLGFIVQRNDTDLNIKVPDYRSQYDITIAEDIVEEVGRSIGYAWIDPVPLNTEIVPQILGPKKELERKIKSIFSSNLSYNEVYNYSFFNKEDLDIENENDNPLKIKNSMPEDFEYLRTSIFPNLLKNIKLNEDRFERIKIFELGRIYNKNLENGKLGIEKHILGFSNYSLKRKENLSDLEDELIIFRTEIESVLFKLNIHDFKLLKEKKKYLHPGSSISFYFDNKLIAELGFLHPELQDKYNLKKRVLIGQIFLENLYEIYDQHKDFFKFQTPSSFPQDSLDLSLVFNEEDPTEIYSDLVKNKKIPEVIDVYVISIFRGGNLPLEKKSVTFRFNLINYKETFTHQKIQSIKDQLIDLANQINLSIR